MSVRKGVARSRSVHQSRSQGRHILGELTPILAHTRHLRVSTTVGNSKGGGAGGGESIPLSPTIRASLKPPKTSSRIGNIYWDGGGIIYGMEGVFLA